MTDRAQRARQYLWALASMIFVAACSATGTYAYPNTFGSIHRELIWVHDVSGDVALLLSILYLRNHLSRTWRMKKLLVSRYTGIAMVLMWSIACATGIYGQIYPLVEGTSLWLLHFVASVATVIGVCFHGLWAYRPTKTN